MTLHEAIVKVLQENMRPMTSREIADILNARKLYIKKDGSSIKPSQISARINNRPQFFTVNKEGIGLIHWFDTNF